MDEIVYLEDGIEIISMSLILKHGISNVLTKFKNFFGRKESRRGKWCAYGDICYKTLYGLLWGYGKIVKDYGNFVEIQYSKNQQVPFETWWSDTVIACSSLQEAVEKMYENNNLDGLSLDKCVQMANNDWPGELPNKGNYE